MGSLPALCLHVLPEMTIRKGVQLTLEASPLNSRSVRRTCGQRKTIESTLKECPISTDGRLFQSRCYPSTCYPGVLAALVPSAIERRRFQRLSHLIADNHSQNMLSVLLRLLADVGQDAAVHIEHVTVHGVRGV